MAQEHVRRTDLLFVSAGREIISDKVYGAPDLVVEVLSPRPRVGQLDRRLDWFARYGVRECWLVDLPGRRLDVLGFGVTGPRSRKAFAPGDALESFVIPGFRLPSNVFG